MVFVLAIALIALVVIGMAGIVAYDMAGRPWREWHQGLKEWQQLTGAVLGLLGAAGVFVLGTEIQADQQRRRSVETQHAIGTGLALEVERLSQGMRAGEYMAGSLSFAGSQEDASKCVLFMSELRRYLPSRTPVYDAVLSRISDFGDQNLTWFVRFYGIYTDLLRALDQSRTQSCSPTTAQADVGYVASLIEGGLQFYQQIQGLYDIVPIATDGEINQRMSTLPGVSAPTMTSPVN